MRAGRLRHRILLENPRLVGEETGGLEPDSTQTYPGDAGWQRVGWLMAEVQDVGARERFTVGQLASGITTNVLMRERADVTAQSRFIFGTRKLYVQGPPIHDTRHRQMTLTCQEKSL